MKSSLPVIPVLLSLTIPKSSISANEYAVFIFPEALVPLTFVALLFADYDILKHPERQNSI